MTPWGAILRRLKEYSSAPFARNVLTTLGGAVSAQAITLLSMIVVTRIYQPEAFALAQSITSILTVLCVVACLRYDVAMASADRRDLPTLAVMCAAILLVFSILCALAVLALNRWGIGRLGLDLGAVAVWALPASLITAMTSTGGAHLLIREGAFGALAGGKILQAIAFGVTAIGLSYAFSLSSGVLIADIIGRLMLASALIIAIARRRPFGLPDLSAKGVADVLAKYRRYPLLSLPGGLLNTLGGAFSTVWMLALFDPHTAGSYALVERVLSAPVALVAGSFAQAYQGRLITHLDKGTPGVSADFTRLLRTQALLGAGLVVFLLIASPFLFRFVFGPQWIQAGAFGQIFGFYAGASLVAFPFNIALVLLGRQKQHFLWEVAWFGLLTGAWMIAWFLALRPEEALALVAGAGALAQGLFLLIAFQQLRRRDRELTDAAAAVNA